MKSLRDISALMREFASRWGSYLLLVELVAAATAGVAVPLMRWATAGILRASGIPYLGVDNLVAVALHHPGAAALLLGLLLVLLVLVYLQFAVLLGGIASIQQREGRGVRAIVREGLADLRHLRPSSFGFFVVYLLLIVPFAGVVLQSALLNKVQIPTFVLEWLATKPLFAVLVAVFYAAAAYLGVRWIRVLPNTILRDQPLSVAARQSWRQTKGKMWRYGWQLTLLTVLTTLVGWAWSGGLIALQTVLDRTPIAFPAAVVLLTLMLAGQTLLGGAASVLYLLFLVAPDGLVPATRAIPNRHHWLRRAFVLGSGGAVIVIMAAFGAFYMTGALVEHPLTISHRGVDAGNGVQNTIPALRKTAALHPDFVEMDLHETKDGQFVVLHDENLKALAGVARTPHQLTLAQLQAVTVRENGHRAKLASFDDYLAAAEKLDQKLIVELKPTPGDSPQMLDHFIRRYAKRLEQDGSRVHSLSYRLMARLHLRVPKLYAGFIMPFSLVAPQTDLSGYTVEETTLDAELVDTVHARHQEVWAWTVNDEGDMAQMLFSDVDGIITDNLSDLKRVIAEQSDHPSYAQRLRLFATALDDLGEPVIGN
ncbi:glycerophosphoryl diester phosphodiesterase membrane domain-containing protein [Lacticaseibacillus kribbianus]|uniref:glycerophosphoryl diester phosphodiesterase membrane domain-containing protein n=1 Tax=Lacticaseibacillus kribbianus TaxID=2926292 RepID=UPI001CD74B98|nr:glycerophosphodiester phosphodiesterase [Lacticaseibacillus kribbianus]